MASPAQLVERADRRQRRPDGERRIGPASRVLVLLVLAACGPSVQTASKGTSPPKAPDATVAVPAPRPTSTTTPVATSRATIRQTPVTTAPPTTLRQATTVATLPPVKVLLGDSITAAFGPYVPGAIVLGGSGQDPVFFPWDALLRSVGRADVVVLQDYVLADWLAVHQAAWQQAWSSLVRTARAVAPTVYILVGGPGGSFLTTLPGIHVAMPPADDPDGIHFTEAGSRRLAALVAGLGVTPA